MKKVGGGGLGVGVESIIIGMIEGGRWRVGRWEVDGGWWEG